MEVRRRAMHADGLAIAARRLQRPVDSTPRRSGLINNPTSYATTVATCATVASDWCVG
jgi:hypothetical protein